MNKRRQTILLVTTLFGTFGCGGATPSIPLRAGRAPEPDLILVWVGHGECERMENGQWVRRPEFDYDFSVEQHRLAGRWESVKSLRRRHPAYDGSAGERSQTYFFELALAATDAGGVQAGIRSSLGNGEGAMDREFRHAVLNIAADVSSFAPFDRYQITQDYDYESGQLTETVELNDGTTPWVRNREVATLFAAHRFDHAPGAQ